MNTVPLRLLYHLDYYDHVYSAALNLSRKTSALCPATDLITETRCKIYAVFGLFNICNITS